MKIHKYISVCDYLEKELTFALLCQQEPVEMPLTRDSPHSQYSQYC